MRASLSLAALAFPFAAQAQETAITPEDRAAIQAELRELQQSRREFDARIEALEKRLGMEEPPPPAEPAAAPAAQGVTAPAPVVVTQDGQAQDTQLAQAATPEGGGPAGFLERQERSGTYQPGAGFVVVDDDDAALYISFTTYARYVNQNALDETYTDSFGRDLTIDLRNEVQLNKVSLNFKGWLFDPKFQYLLFAWTNNANQGEGAQVVLAGFLRYNFSKHFKVTAGIMPLPSTRSTNWSFPNWLRHDNRVMADEFYRASYTSGIDVSGEIVPGLEYRAMIGNNLSTLGVSSRQLDNKFDTMSGALWWMPTTGEFGALNGFGDYDYHEKVATFIGVNYTRSTETAQGQPRDDSFENAQIRLTDGTLLFSPDPFMTGGKLEQARLQMASVDVGVKYQGFSLEGQWYWRWVDDFKTIGFVPVDSITDNGFVVQASAMPIKDLLQVYATASKIWGANGNPTEYSFGVNVYPFRRREMHVNFQTLKLDRSPVGGYHLPIPVGGNGWVFLTDWVVMF
ncbi:hypothetical protein [Altererythrobacter sp. Root672]|uniref:hypothetical protein n=1 Tax=Altererythrobacter sp. Root672 TaxID=1736584 RepID=UPI001F41E32E|nr:hypothetical protein [Altererythrobacter sp. Root672]